MQNIYSTGGELGTNHIFIGRSFIDQNDQNDHEMQNIPGTGGDIGWWVSNSSHSIVIGKLK